MKTQRLIVHSDDLASAQSRTSLLEAARILRNGGLVAFPTETVYGLGANALNADAAGKIFQAKQRPAWDPLIVHIAGRAMLAQVTLDIPLSSNTQKLAAEFWPGPITFLLPRAGNLPEIITAGRPLVGVRMPFHPVAQALLAETGFAIAAPSANSFGRISPTRAEHVLEDLDGRIDAVIDAGEATLGLESTVVDANGDRAIIYRPGMITLDDILRVCAHAEMWRPPSDPGLDSELQSLSPSPGAGLRHYAPRTPLVLIAGDGENQACSFTSAVEEGLEQGLRAGIMLPDGLFPGAAPEWASRCLIFRWGAWSDPIGLAHRLFAGLRLLDSSKLDVIYCPVPPPRGIGAALRDRLSKAADSKRARR